MKASGVVPLCCRWLSLWPPTSAPPMTNDLTHRTRCSEGLPFAKTRAWFLGLKVCSQTRSFAHEIHHAPLVGFLQLLGGCCFVCSRRAHPNLGLGSQVPFTDLVEVGANNILVSHVPPHSTCSHIQLENDSSHCFSHVFRHGLRQRFPEDGNRHPRLRSLALLAGS